MAKTIIDLTSVEWRLYKKELALWFLHYGKRIDGEAFDKELNTVSVELVKQITDRRKHGDQP